MQPDHPAHTVAGPGEITLAHRAEGAWESGMSECGGGFEGCPSQRASYQQEHPLSRLDAVTPGVALLHHGSVERCPLVAD